VVLVEHDYVVETLSAERANNAFCDGVGLRRVDWRGNRIDADAAGALSEIAAVDGIVIAEQMAWFVAPGRGLDELPPHPGCGRVGRHFDMHHLAAAMRDEYQDVQAF
jgi:hypothetical protein